MRNKKGIELTQVGHVFYEYADRILQNCYALSDGINCLVSPFSGGIKIGYTSSFHFKSYAKSIEKFSHRFPNSKMELVEYTGGQTIVEGILTHAIDLGYCSKLYVENNRDLAYKKVELMLQPSRRCANTAAPRCICRFTPSAGGRPRWPRTCRRWRGSRR